MDIRSTETEDWRLLKQVRLAALLDTPTAFGVSYQTALKRGRIYFPFVEKRSPKKGTAAQPAWWTHWPLLKAHAKKANAKLAPPSKAKYISKADRLKLAAESSADSIGSAES
jgi:hypothetical protein